MENGKRAGKDQEIVLTQEELDRLALLEAKRLKDKRRAKGISKGLESFGGGTAHLLRHSVASVGEAIRTWANKAKKTPGRQHTSVARMEKLSPVELAGMTCRVVLNSISTQRSLASACFDLGRLVESESRLRSSPSLEWGMLKKRVRKRMGLKQKMQSALRGMKHRPKAWPKGDKMALGLVLIELFIQSTGLAEIYAVKRGKKRLNYITATKNCEEWLEQFEDRWVLEPVCMPRLQPEAQPGSFWVKCKSHLQEKLYKEQPHYVETCLNALQNVAWSINSNVLEVLENYYANGFTIKGSLVTHQKEIVRVSFDGMDKQQRRDRMKTMSKIHNENIWNKARSYYVTQQMVVARKFRDYHFYLPVQVDFRGRVYYMPSHIGPQKDDLGKALCNFANPKEVSEEGYKWFLLDGSKHFGNDRGTFEERIKWAKDNRSNIESVVADPYQNIWWHEAESPWQFLRWCFAYCRGAETYPVSLDASNNGLQIISLLTGDATMARLTNVLPSPRPSDIYGAVGERLLQEARITGQEWLHQWCNRDVLKRPVMTLAYGVSRYGMAEQVSEKTGLPLHRCLVVADAITRAINDVVPSVFKTMNWFEQVATASLAKDIQLSWLSPSGFPVYQPYFATKLKTIKLRLGDVIRYVSYGEEQRINLDREAQIAGFAPNFVHSLDASVVHIAVSEMYSYGMEQMFCVHDCFGCHPNDVPKMRECVLSSVVKIFSKDILKNLKDTIEASISNPNTLPEPPKNEGFRIDSVINSLYFIK